MTKKAKSPVQNNGIPAEKPVKEEIGNKKPNNMSAEDRKSLNDKARFDYGILNAKDMSEKQLKAEIATIDKQATDAKKADAKSE